MKRLYAPWRSSYARSIAKQKKIKTSAKDCVFCNAIKEDDDEKNLIIARYKYNAVLLNRYPYNAGHLLIIPTVHKSQIHELSHAAQTELMELISQATHTVQKELGAHGVNVGINLGKAAGAGIPSHLHFHVLPRWNGDTNFLPLLADTKQVSFDLVAMFHEIKRCWRKK